MSDFKYVLFLILILSIQISFVAMAGEKLTEQEIQYFTQMANQRGEHEPRKFQTVVLENGLEAFIIEDPTAKLAAASMDVGVGFLMDPPAYPGLAHYLEHVLFLGTEKYRDPSEYREFIAANSGDTNAFTFEDRTNYHFQVSPSAFPEALDRFSEFFSHPRFDERYVAKELDQIESEYQKNIESISFRIFHLQNILSSPLHSQSRVFQGNRETLGQIPRSVVVDFYKKYYSASVMKLVVISPDPLSKTETLIRSQFSKIPRTSHTFPPISTKTMDPKTLPKWVEFKSVGQALIMRMVFELPSRHECFPSNSHSFLTSLLNRKDSKSLGKFLEREGLILGMSANSPLSSYRSLLEVEFSLTDAGYERWKEIGTAFFGYLHLLKEKGLTQDYFSQVQRLNELQYLFHSPSSGSDAAQNFAHLMSLVGPSHLIEKKFLDARWNPEGFQSLLQEITPDKALILLANPGSQGALHEKFYDLEYSVHALEESLVKKWKAASEPTDVSYPDLNVFIPKDLNLIGSPQDKPELLQEDSRSQIWIQTDHTFKKPWADIEFQLISPYPKTLEFEVMKDVYSQFVNHVLERDFRTAQDAGYTFSINSVYLGFELGFKGYSDKIQLLAEEVISKLKQVDLTRDISEVEFATLKEMRIRGLRNSKFQPPYIHAGTELTTLLNLNAYSPEDALPILENLTLKDLQTFGAGLFQQVFIRGFGYGSVSTDVMKSIVQSLDTQLNFEAIHPEQIPTREGVDLGVGKSWTYWTEVSGKNHAWSVYYQTAEMTPEVAAALAVSHCLLSEPFFREMRTERSLGYVVHAAAQGGLLSGGIRFLIQSDQPLDQVASIAENWIQSAAQIARSLPNENFRSIQEGVLETLKKNPATYSDRLAEISKSIFTYNGDWDWKEKNIRALESLTQEKLMQFLSQLMDPQQHRKLSIFVMGKEGAQSPFLREGETEVLDRETFKKSAPRFQKPTIGSRIH